jgi:hypothetical protein
MALATEKVLDKYVVIQLSQDKREIQQELSNCGIDHYIPIEISYRNIDPDQV